MSKPIFPGAIPDFPSGGNLTGREDRQVNSGCGEPGATASAGGSALRSGIFNLVWSGFFRKVP